MLITKGQTSVSVVLRIVDSTDGTPETGVVWNTAGIDLWYRREGAAVVSITEATLAALTSAYSSGGFLHISHGYYRLDVPDAAFASGADGVQIGGTVTGMVVFGPYVQLTDVDLFDSVRAGMTALPNAAADAAGGLPISDAGGLDLDTQLAATNEVTAARMAELDAANLPADVDAILVDTGTTLPAEHAALPTATENADALLKRDWTSVTGEAARSVLNALRSLRNKVSLSGTTMTVTEEDDTTTAWTATVTTDATADPVTGTDPD